MARRVGSATSARLHFLNLGPAKKGVYSVQLVLPFSSFFSPDGNNAFDI